VLASGVTAPPLPDRWVSLRLAATSRGANVSLAAAIDGAKELRSECTICFPANDDGMCWTGVTVADGTADSSGLPVYTNGWAGIACGFHQCLYESLDIE
jgi:hypothetical protein